MKEDLKAIADYWSLRAQGYALDTQNELCDKEHSFYAQNLFNQLIDHRFCNTPAALDIGCGPGFFSILLAKSGFKVTGIDLSITMLTKASELAAYHKVNLKLIKGDIQNPPFAPASFDLIVSRNVFWNLPDLRIAYTKALELLKPHGLMLIFDGNHYYQYKDPDYQKDDPHKTHRHLEDIDVSIIDKIAKKLPASYKLRPDFDLTILKDINKCQAQSEILKSHIKNKKNIIDAFVIKAIKDA